eukprot:Gb_11987 [translate_table: standard]
MEKCRMSYHRVEMLALVFWWGNVSSVGMVKAAPAALLVFGDSLVDSGNNDYIPSIARADSRPYGIDFPGQRPTGRFSNGKIIPDFTSEMMGLQPILPYLDPTLEGDRLLEGANFASAGVGVLNDTGVQFIAIIRIPEQFENFRRYQDRVAAIIGRPATNQLISQAMVYITVGGNDFVNNYFISGSLRSRTLSISAFIQLVATEYKKQLASLYELGARKIVITAVGPLGCVPSELATRSRNGECDQTLQETAAQYNAVLRSQIDALNREYPDATFVFANSFSMNMNFITNPRAFGFETSKVACCGQGPYNRVGICTVASNLCSDRTKNVFWDPFHPTEKGNRIIATRFMDGSSSDISPVNMRTLMGL